MPEESPNPLQDLPPSSEVRARLGQCLQETQLLRSLLRLSERVERGQPLPADVNRTLLQAAEQGKLLRDQEGHRNG